MRENIYRSNIQVTFELNGQFRFLLVLYSKQNCIYYLLSYSVDFKAPRELWNPLSEAVPGKFHGCGGHCKCNCLQVWVNFNIYRAWHFVLISNTVYTISLESHPYLTVVKAATGIWGPVYKSSPQLCNNASATTPINTLRPRQNGRHFPDDIFKWIFVNENAWI